MMYSSLHTVGSIEMDFVVTIPVGNNSLSAPGPIKNLQFLT